MKKHFGQHLLINKNYLQEILEVTNLESSNTVLEIGAGTGLLTCLLAQRVKKVFAVEMERDIVKKLKENLKKNQLNNVEIIEKDFLRLDLVSLIKNKIKVIGNIPYNITSKILLKLFGEIDKPVQHLKLIESIYLMVQLEVGERIVAKPNSKAYSPLSLLVQYFSLPQILFKVPRQAFYPVPKVDSAFVEFDIRQKLQPVKNPTLLKNIIRTSFQQRRKKAINALDKLVKDKNHIANIFDKLKLNHNLRPENLSFEDYIAISNII